MSGSTITPWVVGNWKMNPMQANAQQLVQDFTQLLTEQVIDSQSCRIGVAPTTLALLNIKDQLKNSSVDVMTVAQDVSRMA